jgi:hypothetical protein
LKHPAPTPCLTRLGNLWRKEVYFESWF